MPLSRRMFLAGTAGVAVLTACGSDSDELSDSSTASTPTDGSDGDSDDGLAVFTFFDSATLVAGAEIRAPIAIGDIDGPLPIADSPAELTFTTTDEAGDEVAAGAATFRSEGLPRGYYPVRFTPPAAGLYDLTVTADGLPALTTTLQLVDPASIVIPGPGDPFPVLDTPTTDKARGVTPICTREPMCSLHSRNLPELLLDGSPSAVMISTPKFCSTAVCGPVLDLLLAEAAARPDVSMLHAEVYADPEADLSTVAPIVKAMSLTFEPSLVFLDPDGTIVERLDFVFDASEMRDAFDRLTA